MLNSNKNINFNTDSTEGDFLRNKSMDLGGQGGDGDKMGVSLKQREMSGEGGNQVLAKRREKDSRRRWGIKVGMVTVVIGVALGIGMFLPGLMIQPEKIQKSEHSEASSAPVKYYSRLSGEQIAGPGEDKLPTFCVQIPNGLDGARPHVGLSEAKVVFEAIAEGGITRFAAIFQGAKAGAIGPIRSLRTYFLSWDTPFDCTVVHAGGSGAALAAIKAGGQRDLTESRSYMWRDHNGYQAPNNLFTAPELLNQFNQTKGYANSEPQGFSRFRPEEMEAKKSEEKEEEQVEVVKASEIRMNFGGIPGFNILYNFDQASNSYLRSYQDGSKHLSYNCPVGKNKPRPKMDCGVAQQLAPKVVIALWSEQNLTAYDYPGKIKTTGAGEAYIFQNGEVIVGSWNKASDKTQLEFKDKSGGLIKLAPGQVWISAIPKGQGSVRY